MTTPPRDELVIKVLIAARLPGADVHGLIQVHRRYLVQLMQEWTRLKEDEGEFDLGLALAVDAELYRLDAVIRWLDAADGRLARDGGSAGTPSGRTCPRCAAGWRSAR